MRLLFTISLLLFFLACSSDGRKVAYKVIPPARLKAIIDQKKNTAKGRSSITSHTQYQAGTIILRHPAQPTDTEKSVISAPVRMPDSLNLKKTEYLRASGIQPDFSEPMNRDLMQRQGGDSSFESAISLGTDRVLKIGFENDIFDYTDQFYTNGIRFEFIAPGLCGNPIGHVLLPYWGKAKNYYGISLVQNLYTPSTTKLGGILYGDRPYSSYLYLGSFKISNDVRHHFRQTSGLNLGVIGPLSMGGTVQDLFHKYVPTNNEPLGWEYQVKTDAVVNYNITMEKGVINGGNVQLLLTGTGALGTLYTNFSGGFRLRLGWFNDYFSDVGIRKKRDLKANGLRVKQFFFTIKGCARMVAYDATLEGGLFNRSSPYTLPASAVSALVTESTVGFTITFGAVGLEMEQVLLSPEFNNNWWHAWGHFGLLFAL